MIGGRKPIQPRHIAITGASSGIGAGLAHAYAGPGQRLSLTARSTERLEAVRSACQTRGAEVDTAAIDVTDGAATGAWLARIDAERPVDLVVANAGVSAGTVGRGGDLRQTRAILATNIDGVVNTVLPAIALMRARPMPTDGTPRGQIAIVSSMAAFRGIAGAAAYCASKGAVRLWGQGLRAELAPIGVAVSVICPGFVESRITDGNTHPMPFLLTADRSGDIIRRGLARNRGKIAYPWPLAWMAYLGAVLPGWVSDAVIGRSKLPNDPGPSPRDT